LFGLFASEQAKTMKLMLNERTKQSEGPLGKAKTYSSHLGSPALLIHHF